MRDGADLFFFLGGRDLEMLEIRRLLEEFAPGRFYDAGLGWGAKASDYENQIKAVLADGGVAVLVELENDLGLSGDRVLTIDHHDLDRGRSLPSSLRQVFDLLRIPESEWTRRRRLVSANDRGHVKAMLDEGATIRELREIRAEDRAAQGITPSQQRQANAAVADAKDLAAGRLTLVRCPHSRTAAVTDRLDSALGGPGFENLLIDSPEEINFFGSGRLVRRLQEMFPGGWFGGALPERGFWGIRNPGREALVDELADLLSEELSSSEGTEREN